MNYRTSTSGSNFILEKLNKSTRKEKKYKKKKKEKNLTYLSVLAFNNWFSGWCQRQICESITYNAVKSNQITKQNFFFKKKHIQNSIIFQCTKSVEKTTKR